MVPISELLTEREAAQALHVSPKTLPAWRSTRRYPLKFVKIGRRVYYKREDLQKFIEARTIDPGAGASKRGVQ